MQKFRGGNRQTGSSVIFIFILFYFFIKNGIVTIQLPRKRECSYVGRFG